jgi:hypothetical protein
MPFILRNHQCSRRGFRLPLDMVGGRSGTPAPKSRSPSAQVSPLAPLLLDMISDVPANLAHQLNNCSVLLDRMSLAAGIDVVPRRMDVASRASPRFSVDENSSADDERLLLQVLGAPDEVCLCRCSPFCSRRRPVLLGVAGT